MKEPETARPNYNSSLANMVSSTNVLVDLYAPQNGNIVLFFRINPSICNFT